MTQNWRGKPLVSHDLIVKLIGSTTTTTGLKVKAALDTSVVLHVVTAAALAGVGFSLHLGIPYWTGVTIVCAMLAYEHSLLSPTDLSKLNAAFFNINGIISILAFVSIFADKLLWVFQHAR